MNFEVNETFLNEFNSTTSLFDIFNASITPTVDYGPIITESPCPKENISTHISTFGFALAVPEWQAILTTVLLSFIIIFTIVGNVLVILSVFTYKPLRIVQNFFIVSLAVADLTVAVLVLPFNVTTSILGKWHFGRNMCLLWLTCDVLCCTSSILNLCAIALDRYWAITDPINYAQKRTVERVLLLIAGVWCLSLLISSPPLFGWNDWNWNEEVQCQLTQEKGYVIYSALGSFYIPLLIMTIVYIEIFIATRRRLRERAQAAKLNTMASRNLLDKDNNTIPVHNDQESVSSETNHNEHPNVSDAVANAKSIDKRKNREKRKKLRLLKSFSNSKKEEKTIELKPPDIAEDSITDNNPNDNSSDNLKQQQQQQQHHNGENVLVPNMDATEVTIISNSTKPVVIKCTKRRKSRSFRKSGGVYQFIEEKQKISLSKERRAARTLGIIMGVFVICWLPFFLVYVIQAFCESCCFTTSFSNFITWLGYINSSLNPIIYTIFNLEYRRAFKRLLGIKF